MSAPELDLIVPTRSIVPSREAGSRERFVMMVTMVMVVAFRDGRRTQPGPRRNGSFLAIFQYGGRERGISPPTGRETGLPLEVTGYHAPTMPISATGANRKPLQTLFWVRTVAKRGAHASRMDHGEEGPLLPRGWPSLDRQNGDRRKLSNGAGLGPFQHPMASNR